jgi:hypothetical protein
VVKIDVIKASHTDYFCVCLFLVSENVSFLSVSS